MSDYPNLDMMERGGCGPTSDWIRVIPEIRALRAELAAAREEIARLRDLSVWGTAVNVGETFDALQNAREESRRIREAFEDRVSRNDCIACEAVAAALRTESGLDESHHDEFPTEPEIERLRGMQNEEISEVVGPLEVLLGQKNAEIERLVAEVKTQAEGWLRSSGATNAALDRAEAVEARTAKLVEALERYVALSEGCDYGGGETCPGGSSFPPCPYHMARAALRDEPGCQHGGRQRGETPCPDCAEPEEKGSHD